MPTALQARTSAESLLLGSVHYRDDRAAFQLADWLRAYAGPSPTILCIGTDRSTGDALGPMVGTLLRELRPQLPVFGTLEEPVHAQNLGEVLPRLHGFVLAIDAMLGRVQEIGSIKLISGPLRPGTAFGRDLPSVGDAHLVGVVNVGGFMEYVVLQNTRLSVVWSMARVIAEAIDRAFGGDVW